MTTAVTSLLDALSQVSTFLDGTVGVPVLLFDRRNFPAPYVTVSAVGSRSGETDHEVRVRACVPASTELELAQREIVRLADLVEGRFDTGGYGPVGFDTIEYDAEQDLLVVGWLLNVPRAW